MSWTIETPCSNPHSDTGFGVLGCHLPPTGRNHEGEVTSSKRSSAICFSSRSRPSLHHLAWKCVIRRRRGSTSSSATRPSCWSMHHRGRGSSQPSRHAWCRTAAQTAARAPHASTAGQWRWGATWCTLPQPTEGPCIEGVQSGGTRRLLRGVGDRGAATAVGLTALEQQCTWARAWSPHIFCLLCGRCNAGLHKEGRVQRTYVYMCMYDSMAIGRTC